MASNDMRTQDAAARHLEKLFGEEALIVALKHSSSTTRRQAARRLQFHRTPSVRDALLKAVEEPMEATRISITHALSEVCDVSCIPALKRLQQDHSDLVREEANAGLRKLGEQR